MKFQLSINNKDVTVDVPEDMPLLWVLRQEAGLKGTKFGCGAGLCGACSVHIDGEVARSCVTPVSMAAGSEITTIEGLPEQFVETVQEAWKEEIVPQCGYCQSGQIMRAADLLARNPNPTREEIVAHMSTNICRCGTYNRIIRAVQRATREA